MGSRLKQSRQNPPAMSKYARHIVGLSITCKWDGIANALGAPSAFGFDRSHSSGIHPTTVR